VIIERHTSMLRTVVKRSYWQDEHELGCVSAGPKGSRPANCPYPLGGITMASAWETIPSSSSTGRHTGMLEERETGSACVLID
jgi:hypothetical protein